MTDFIPKVKENTCTRTLIKQLDDLVNLARQMQMTSSIDYIGEKIEPIKTKKIQEYAKHMSYQFKTMEGVCEELLINPIICNRRSARSSKRTVNFFRSSRIHSRTLSVTSATSL